MVTRNPTPKTAGAGVRPPPGRRVDYLITLSCGTEVPRGGAEAASLLDFPELTRGCSPSTGTGRGPPGTGPSRRYIGGAERYVAPPPPAPRPPPPRAVRNLETSTFTLRAPSGGPVRIHFLPTHSEPTSRGGLPRPPPPPAPSPLPPGMRMTRQIFMGNLHPSKNCDDSK